MEKTTCNTINLNDIEEVLFSSLSKEEQEDYLSICDHEMKEYLKQKDATVPKPITIILGFFIYKLYPSVNTLIIVLISGMIFVYYIEKYKRFLFIKSYNNKNRRNG